MEGREGISTANRREIAEPSGDPRTSTRFVQKSRCVRSSDVSPGPWWATLLAASAIIAVTVAAYWHSLDGEFMFDDRVWIVENPSIKHLWPLGDVLLPADAAHVGGRPIVSLSLAVNYALGGLDVRGYHAVNLAIHICAALVLFGVVRRTLVLPRLIARFGEAATPLAAIVALIWAVHPIQTEAVSYVIQRAESLVGLFYLLTLYCFIRGATARATKPLWYLACFVACLLGMATKEVMVTAPIVLLLYDRTFLSDRFGSRWPSVGGFILRRPARGWSWPGC